MLDSGLLSSHQLFLAAMLVSGKDKPLLAATCHSVCPLVHSGVPFHSEFLDSACDLGKHGVSGCACEGHLWL